MKQFLIIQFLCFLAINGYAQKISISGETVVHPNSSYGYLITIDPPIGSTEFFVTCGKNGKLVDYGDTIAKIKIKDKYMIAVQWNDVEVSNAYVRVFAVYNPANLQYVLKNINIKKIPEFSLQLKCSKDYPLQIASFEVEALTDPFYKINDYNWSCNDFVISSGQGTRKMTGFFTSSGNKEINLKVVSGSYEQSIKKTVSVFPNSIDGSNLVCDKSSFSIKNLPSGIDINRIEWSLSNNKLEILPGLNNNSIDLSVIPNKFGTEILSARIISSVIDYTIKKEISTGVAMVQSISGLRYAPLNIIEAYYAEPRFSDAEASYQWIVIPSEDVVQRPSGYINSITFKKTGKYTITCRAQSNNCKTQTPPPSYIEVTVGGFYIVSSDSKLVTITKNNLEDITSISKIEDSSPIIYELHDQKTGIFHSRGTISRDGGTLDFSRLHSGIYVLNLFVNKSHKETHKIIIK